jgi:uncharacterized protein YfaP (DUF2135 family)
MSAPGLMRSLTGLAAGGSVVLANGDARLTLTAARTFEFSGDLADRTAYVVTVVTQPPGQFCNVARGSGTVAGAAVSNIAVACARVLAGGSGTVTSAGGTVSTAALDMTIPQAASLAAQTVTVTSIVPPAGLPAALTPVGMALDVNVSQADKLNAPVLMTIRYDDAAVVNEDDLAVVHFNTSTRRYEPVTVLAQDKTANTFKIESRTFSPFAVVAMASPLPASHSVTNFSAVSNGWNIDNFGSYFSPGGNCLGMSGYAAWYFGNRAGTLNSKFSAVGSVETSIAGLVSARAHLAQSQYWAQKSNTYLASLGNASTARLMRVYLALLDQPIILLLGANGSPRHASVLYGYDANGFRFYDVNQQGAAQSVSFDGTNWGTYGGYNSFGFVALPSLGRTEDFAQLTTEAEGGFASSALIAVTTPRANQQVAARQINLAGSLSGALNSSRSLVTYVQGVPQQVPVTSGNFSATLPVSTGQNTVVLFAGVDIANQSNWFRNAATRIININGTQARTALLATLTWDQDLSDVDLYVTEPSPSSQTAWYDNQITSNRLELDFDNTVGYGPEHATLSLASLPAGTVLPGLYRIRVHYYEDFGAGPTVSGTVSILINEGQPNQQLVSRRFTVRSASSSNTGPGGTGSNWAEIATVDLVNSIINVTGP